MLQEYNFEVVYKTGTKNLDAGGLSCNPSPLQEDLIGARRHDTLDQEAVPGWHASAYLAWMEGGSSQTTWETRDGNANDAPKFIEAQDTMDVWRDQGVLHQLQRRKFLLDTTPKKRDRIVHRMARFH